MKVYSLIEIPNRKETNTKLCIFRPFTNQTCRAIRDRCYNEQTKTFTIPEGFTHLLYFCFCSDVANTVECLVIPASVKKIDENAFKECINLKKIVVSKGNLYYWGTCGMLSRTDNCKPIWVSPQATSRNLTKELIGKNLRLQKLVQKLENKRAKYEKDINLKEVLAQDEKASSVDMFSEYSITYEEPVLYNPDEISNYVTIYKKNTTIIRFMGMVFCPDVIVFDFVGLHSRSMPIYKKTIENSYEIIYYEFPLFIEGSNNIRVKVTGPNRVDFDSNGELIFEVVDMNNKRLPDSEIFSVEFSIKDRTYAVYTL